MRCSRLLLAAFVLPGAAGCAPGGGAGAQVDAEFLLATEDSTYWVRHGPEGLRVRGAPVLLAAMGGGFHEVYVVDDDRSFEDAVFVGQRVYRRDLVTGDSLLVFEDTIVPRAASRWAQAHPRSRLMLEDEDYPGEEPADGTTSTFEVVALHGPFVSFEYHVDIEATGAEPWHTTRRGVIDLRTGAELTLPQLVGDSAAARLVATSRAALRETEARLRFAGEPRARRASRALQSFRFDERSFTLTLQSGRPVIEFVVPGRGEGPSGLTLPLPSIPVDSVRDWRLALVGAPTSEHDDVARWVGPRYDVVARQGDDTVEVTLVSRNGRTRIGRFGGRLERVHRLDDVPMPADVRRALGRAFEEAALYDDDARTAALPAPVVLVAAAHAAAAPNPHFPWRAR